MRPRPGAGEHNIESTIYYDMSALPRPAPAPRRLIVSRLFYRERNWERSAFAGSESSKQIPVGKFKHFVGGGRSRDADAPYGPWRDYLCKLLALNAALIREAFASQVSSIYCRLFPAILLYRYISLQIVFR